MRVHVTSRGRVAILEINESDLVIGSDPHCDLVIHESSVAPRHARLLVRRGRLILAELGRAKHGTTRSGERVNAPVALMDGQPFALGDVDFAAWPIEAQQRGLVGSRIAEGAVVCEISSADPCLRRYRVLLNSGGHGELVVTETGIDAARVTDWWTRVLRSRKPTVKSVPGAICCDPIEGRSVFLELVPGGVRLDAVVAGVTRDLVRIPLEASFVVLAQVAEALAATHDVWGPHGLVEPRRIQLGLDGSVSLLRPPPVDPKQDVYLDRYLSTERRCGLPPAIAADAHALGRIGQRLLWGRNDAPDALQKLCRDLTDREPDRRPQDLSRIAERMRTVADDAALDPTSVHVARIVRLLAPELSRRFCTIPNKNDEKGAGTV